MASKPIELEQAQVRLKELVDQAARGEEVLLAEEGKAVAKIIPVGQRVAKRQFGSARGLIHVPDEFDEPLDDFREYQ